MNPWDDLIKDMRQWTKVYDDTKYNMNDKRVLTEKLLKDILTLGNASSNAVIDHIDPAINYTMPSYAVNVDIVAKVDRMNVILEEMRRFLLPQPTYILIPDEVDHMKKCIKILSDICLELGVKTNRSSNVKWVV
jgi:hypothetical protein